MNKKRYAVCGVSSRAIGMYIAPMLRQFTHCAELVALLDIDPLRFQVCKDQVPEAKDVPEYEAADFDRMMKETRPDALLVVCMDKFHIEYIIRGLAYDVDVISEKPMTTNTADALRALEAEKKSKGRIICTFNYRYQPLAVKLKEMITGGKIGKVTHVDLNWYIDIHHGSSYFHRWNRMRENSGSLSIHKSSHHFDLVNWWVDDIPERVHAFGALNHYGPDAVFNPSRKDGRHCSECDEKLQCPYKARWTTRNSSIFAADDHINAFEGPKKLFTSYRPDMCMFDSAIDIYDTFIVNVKYRGGVLLNYSANFSTPYEGYRLSFNGTHGRIETFIAAGACASALPPFTADGRFSVFYYPIFQGREQIHLVGRGGSHGGGDSAIQEDIFLGEDPCRKFDILAKSVDGLRAIAIGDAVFESIKDGQVKELDSFIR